MIKLGLNLFLIPLWDIRGAALATVIGYGIATLLNLLALKSQIPGLRQKQPLTSCPFYRHPLDGAAAYGTVWLLTQVTAGMDSLRLAMTVTALGAVMVGAGIYAFTLFRLGVLTRADLESVPKMRKLVPIMESLHLIRKKEEGKGV